MIAALSARLAELAKDGKTITYGQLARDLDVRIGALTAALEALMEQDAALGHPFRAALCEGRLAGGLPARGFFDKAATLGRDIRDPAELVRSDREALFAAAGSR